MRRILAGLCVLVGLALVGCGVPRTGRLVIAGGATEADNAEVYDRFMHTLAPDAMIGVLPTASGVPEESAASSAATLRRYAGTRRVEVIDLTVRNAADASSARVVGQIDSCGALWFTGGDQKRIVSVFRPSAPVPAPGRNAGELADPNEPWRVAGTPAYDALTRVLSRGGVIGGTSAGAAMMSDPMITGGRSEDALLGKLRATPEDSGFGMGPGMGFFPFGVTDQHFLKRGRLGRLVVALEHERVAVKRGYGIEENSAIDVDLATGDITVLGPDACVVLVDAGESTRDGAARRGVRVSLLRSGDTVSGSTGRVRPGAGRRADVGAPSVTGCAATARGEQPDAWAAGAVAWALRELASRPETPVELHSPAFDVRFSADGRTRFFRATDASGACTVTGVRLDILLGD